jgi:hypothetical protein
MKNLILPILLTIHLSSYSYEYKDTTLKINQTLLLEFNISNTIECGVNIY